MAAFMLVLGAAAFAPGSGPLAASGALPQPPELLTQGKPAPAQATAPSAEAAAAVNVDETTVGKRVPPRPGDICRVCNHPVHDGDVVYVVRGQRVPMHRAEVEADLAGQLVRLLAQLEPRGAFLRARDAQRGLSRFWFFAGLYILVGLIFAALCAHRALHLGQSPILWFSLGLLLNVVGYLVLRTRPPREVRAPAGVPRGLRKIAATYAPQPCAKCGTLNHPSASDCAGCGAKLEPRITSEVARAGLGSA